MNLQIPPENIVKLLDSKLGTQRGDAIFHEIKTLIRPPRPYPEAETIAPRFSKDKTLPLFHYIGTQDCFRKYYTFLVCGETGAGKTTLLDAFVNKLTGMQYTDNWRWKLVDESKLNSVPNGKSKTSNIKCYYINDHQNKFNIKIIDTPGFGDTADLKMDDRITDMFQDFFCEIESIDYILLTVKSSEKRLSYGSKYVYDRIQQLFGVDAKDRFILMCTFADDKTPVCIATIGNTFSYEKYFTFNNSALYTPSENANKTGKFYWKMGMESIKLFQKYIIEQDKPPLSLKLSSDVLSTRKYLCQMIKTSQQCLLQYWNQFDRAKKTFKSMQENQQKIQQNRKFTQIVTKQRYDSTDFHKTVQVCSNCYIICCHATYSTCICFNKEDACSKCPGRCPRKSHIRTKTIPIKVSYQVEEIIDYKKKMYEQGVSGAKLYLKVIGQQIDKIDKLATRVWTLVEEIKKNLAKLQQTALKPKLFTDREFYQKMMSQQQEQKKEGWSERVTMLKEIIGKIDNLQKIQKCLSLDQLFPDLKTLKTNYQEYEKKNKDQNCNIF